MPQHRPLLRRFITGLTLKRAIGGITLCAFAATVAAALLIRIVEPDTFGDFESALWWAAQTVSTVGYGDRVPESTAGKAVGIAVMLFGIALVPAITSLVIAVFLNQQVAQMRAEDQES